MTNYTKTQFAGKDSSKNLDKENIKVRGCCTKDEDVGIIHILYNLYISDTYSIPSCDYLMY